MALPAAYLESLGGSADEAVGRQVTFGYRDAEGTEQSIDATVSGVIRRTIVPAGAPVASESLALAIHADQTRGLTATQVPPTASAIVTLSGGLTDAQVEQVKADLTAAGLEGSTVNDRLGTFHTAITAISGALSAFAAITLLAAAFGIINTLLMAVQERTREIGILKAHGLRSHRVFLMFCTEAGVIGLTGALLGAVLGAGLGLLANRVATERLADLPGLSAFAVDPSVVLAIVAGITALALAAGALPAVRASRRDPIAALRHE